MSINIPPNERRDVLLRKPIGQLVTWHLITACDECRAEHVVMVQDLERRFGPEATLLSLLRKLRCALLV